MDEKREDLLALVKNVISEIGVNLNISEIDRVQRLGIKRANQDKIRPILLATTTFQNKVKKLEHKMKIKPSTYITRDLSKEAIQKLKNKNQVLHQNNDAEKKSAKTPSPGTSSSIVTQQADLKIKRTDAFQVTRARAYSNSEKNTYKN